MTNTWVIQDDSIINLQVTFFVIHLEVFLKMPQPGAILYLSKTFCLVLAWGCFWSLQLRGTTGVWYVEARDAAYHPQTQNSTPTPKNDPSLDVLGVMVEKPHSKTVFQDRGAGK